MAAINNRIREREKGMHDNALIMHCMKGYAIVFTNNNNMLFLELTNNLVVCGKYQSTGIRRLYILSESSLDKPMLRTVPTRFIHETSKFQAPILMLE